MSTQCGCSEWRKIAVFVTPEWFRAPEYLEMMRKKEVDKFWDIRTKVSSVLLRNHSHMQDVVNTWSGVEGAKYHALDNDSVVIAWMEWIWHHRKYHPELPRYLAQPRELLVSDSK
jgi:hypothetical protein